MPSRKRKVVVIGADGQLGFDLVRVFQEHPDDFEVVALTHADADVTDGAGVKEKIVSLQPNVVINAVGFVRVADCEKEPEKSFAVNALGAYHVAVAAALVRATVVYVSTNYVFDGAKKAYTEEDVADPLNVYGASKLAGETLTKIATPNHYIVRGSIFFGTHATKGPNFVSLMLELAKQGKEISVVSDEFASPTYTKDFSEKIREIILKKAPFGIYHVANMDRISMFAFAKMIFAEAGLSPKLKAIKVADRHEGFRRPASAVLDGKALLSAGIESMRSLEEALKAYFDES